MKKNVWRVLSLLVLLTFFSVTCAFAGQTNYKEFPLKDNVAINKDWTIIFSNYVDPHSINLNSIKVVNSSTGQLAPNPVPEVIADGKSVMLKCPAHGYEYGTKYTLYVDGVKSYLGESLAQPARKQFITVAEGGQGPIPSDPDADVYDLIAKSVEESLKYNTVSMEGKFNLAIDMGEGDNLLLAFGLPENAMVILEGQAQNDPFEAHLQGKIQGYANGEPMETPLGYYVNKDYMYSYDAEDGWEADEMPISADLFQKAQNILFNPLSALVQLKELGIEFKLGDNEVVNGVNCRVIKAVPDNEKLAIASKTLLPQMLHDLSEDSNYEDDFMLDLVIGILQNADTDLALDFAVYVNETTFISEMVCFDVKIGIKIKGEIELDINLALDGDVTITGLGEPFVKPDIPGLASTTPGTW